MFDDINSNGPGANGCKDTVNWNSWKKRYMLNPCTFDCKCDTTSEVGEYLDVTKCACNN